MTIRKLMLPTTMLTFCLLLAGSLLVLMQSSAAAATPVATPVATSAAQTNTDSAAVERPAGWSEETHSNAVTPNYATVFPADQVNQITITVSAENWAAMQADMTELYGEKGTGRGRPMGGGNPGNWQQPPTDGEAPADMPQPPGGNEAPGEPPAPPADGEAPADMPEPPGGGQRPPGGGMGGGEFTTENPIWVTSTIEFDGNVWTNVGIRYKGNSSLMSSWNSGSLKLPFKLNFDEFEDVYPEIDNQRFYGFQQLSFGNNFSDDAMMRDALAYDVYEATGLVAADTGFYEVFLDYGEGVVRLGMYTAVEVIDDTVVAQAFDGDSGNLYEGDGRYVSLAEGTTAEQIEESFQKENNEDVSDWSDIQALYDVLHSDLRSEDPAAWREELEAVFDVDTFLKWLAVSAQIGHWDTYGAMSHNFYLYDNPATGQLTWVTWDHNMTFSSGMGGSMGGPPAQRALTNTLPVTGVAPITATAMTTATTTAPGAPMERPNRGPGGFGDGPGGGRSVTLDKAGVSDQWPLIRFLLDDPVYYERYVEFLAETSAIVAPEAMTERIETYAEILAPYAEQDEDAATYESAVQRLIDYVTTRADEVQTFLDEQ